ncbi:MAG: phenylacetate--CoA ligase family protein, partial [Rhodospirillales bacterium]
MGADNPYFDALETRIPEQREQALFRALPGQIALAMGTAGFARILKGVDPKTVTGRAALAKLPVTRKSALIAMQKEHPPFAGLAAAKPGELARIFVSPGPIFDPEGRRADWWRFARALYAAGFRRGDLVLNCFSYHLTPAGSMLETGAHALRCAVIPGGVGNSESQVQAIQGLKPRCFTGTPSFLKIILDKAAELGADMSSLARAMVSA